MRYTILTGFLTGLLLAPSPLEGCLIGMGLGIAVWGLAQFTEHDPAMLRCSKIP